jgi:hypothetical protein
MSQHYPGRPLPLVWQLGRPEVPVTEKWLAENPSVRAADAALIVSLIFEEDGIHQSFDMADGRDGSLMRPEHLFHIWQSLGRALARDPRVRVAEREVLLETERLLSKVFDLKPLPDEPGLIDMPSTTEAGALAIAERARPHLAEAVKRSIRERLPLSDYCVLMDLDPSTDQTKDRTLRVDELRYALPEEESERAAFIEAFATRHAAPDRVFVVVVTVERSLGYFAATLEVDGKGTVQ